MACMTGGPFNPNYIPPEVADFCKKTNTRFDDIVDFRVTQNASRHVPDEATVRLKDGTTRIYRVTIGPDGREYLKTQESIPWQSQAKSATAYAQIYKQNPEKGPVKALHEWVEVDGLIRCAKCKTVKGWKNRMENCEKHLDELKREHEEMLETIRKARDAEVQRAQKEDITKYEHWKKQAEMYEKINPGQPYRVMEPPKEPQIWTALDGAMPSLPPVKVQDITPQMMAEQIAKIKKAIWEQVNAQVAASMFEGKSVFEMIDESHSMKDFKQKYLNDPIAFSEKVGFTDVNAPLTPEQKDKLFSGYIGVDCAEDELPKKGEETKTEEKTSEQPKAQQEVPPPQEGGNDPR